MLLAEDGEVTTVMIEPYLTTFSDERMNPLYGKTGNSEFTGSVHYLTPCLVKIGLPNGEWIIFDIDDVIELRG
jgi:hypothetical protein